MLRSSPGRTAAARARKRQLLSSGITRSTRGMSRGCVEGQEKFTKCCAPFW
jgi:hypothetical protein